MTVTSIEGRTTIGPIDRLILFGGGPLLETIAGWARAQGLGVTAVLSPRHATAVVDERSGRMLGERLRESIETHVVDSIRKAPLGDVSGALGLSLGAAWRFPPAVIARFGGNLLNAHGTRLPHNRGGGGFSWQILMGSRLGACTLHMIDDQIDTGDIVAMEEFIYPAACRTPADFARFYQERMERFLTNTVSSVSHRSQSFPRMSQAGHLSTHWPRLHTDTHGWIDWSQSAEAIDRLVCAFDEPHAGAQTFWRSRRVRLKGSLVDRADGRFHPLQRGVVFRNNGKWLAVAANDATLVVERVVSADDPSNTLTAQIRPGDRFMTPPRHVAAAMSRVVYTPAQVRIEPPVE